MKWIWSRCRRRQDVSLLAAGVLDQAEIIELERHLDACADCRNYYGEIKILTAPLMGWEKNFSAIEANPAMQMRWAKAMQDAAAPSSIRQPPLQRVWRAMWGESVRPYRYAWSGMAALWVAMLAINLTLSDDRTSDAGARSSSSQEMIQAWEEQNRVLAELIQPAAVVRAPPPHIPGPRSQRKQDSAII
jgi:hypothetical protein